MNNIAFIGDLTVDKYPELRKTHLGGASLNSAVWAIRAGADHVTVFAAVGTDSYGTQYKEWLTRKGVSTTGLSILPGTTSTIEIFLEQNGERRWGPWKEGVLADYHFGAHEFALLQTHKVAVLTVYRKTQQLLSEFTGPWKGSGKKPIRVVNFGDLSHFSRSIKLIEDNIANLDIVFLGLQMEKDRLILSALRKLSRETGKQIIVTLAQHGAIAWKGNTEYSSPVFHVTNIVDTTGAGDAFLSGFLVRYLKSNDIQSSLDAGNHLAAKKIQILGAY